MSRAGNMEVLLQVCNYLGFSGFCSWTAMPGRSGHIRVLQICWESQVAALL